MNGELDAARKSRGVMPSRPASTAALSLAMLVPAAVAGQRSANPAALVFEGVTVVNVRDGRLLPDETIVVAGHRISAVGRVRDMRVPAGAQVIKAYGTYAIPGLWDMHVHPFGLPETFYPLFIANGVTGVREMWTPFLDSVLQWRREVAAGTRVGPRVVTPGPVLETPSTAQRMNRHMSYWTEGAPFEVGVASPDAGRRVVDSLKHAGADFIKVRDNLPRDVYFAIAAEARRLGMPLAGHLPGSVTLLEASDSGQHSIEHGLMSGGVASHQCNLVPTPIDQIASVDPKSCRALAERFLRNDTWFSVADPGMASCSLLSRCDDLMRYWPDWLFDSVPNARPDPRAAGARERRSLERWASVHAAAPGGSVCGDPLLGEMRHAGIRFLAGTDANPNSLFLTTVPGFSLHDLLWCLVRSGLTSLEVLQSTTLDPAEYFHATDSLGGIAPDQLADFVLLDANPLADIYNTRRIRAVVANGRFFDRGDLDVLLLDVERTARISHRRP